MSTVKQNKNSTIFYCGLVLPEGMGAQGGKETPSAESAAAVECPKVPSTSVFRAHGTVGSGQVLTEAVLQTQRDTIDANKGCIV